MTAPAAAREPVYLDLACGADCAQGFMGVDLVPGPGVRWLVDLCRFPWPFDAESVDGMNCSHFVEHLPAREVELRDVHDPQRADRYVGKDFFVAFFDECWRILRPGGFMMVLVPYARSTRAFQDPTHRRFLVEESFGYLSLACRRSLGVGHYYQRVICDFDVILEPRFSAEGKRRRQAIETLPQAQQAAALEELLGQWNVIADLRVTLKKPTP